MSAKDGAADEGRDELEPEIVEDLDVEEDDGAEDVRGGSLGCLTL